MSVLLRCARRCCEEGSLKCNPSSSSSDVPVEDDEEVAVLGGWRACLSTPKGIPKTHNQGTGTKHPGLCNPQVTLDMRIER